MPDFDAARARMVACQIAPGNVTDRRLTGAFATVPRERFVPEERRAVAYVDEDIAVAGERRLMAPAALARLIAGAGIGPGDTVLDIGCATGYSTAVLGRIAAAAIGIESDPGLAAEAGDLLVELGIDNAVVVNRPLENGYAGQAPYHQSQKG